jgi:2-polyprenyl-6-methoxyphenol hydroxylase-like FAD-dependent oxidoreductase
MLNADVAIIGAGAAGSLAAIMLARQGHSVLLIDPTHPYRPEFRCEKIDYRHAEVLSAAGVLDEVTPVGTRYEGIWLARQGRFIENRPLVEYGVDYEVLVNRLRELLPESVRFVQQKAVGASTGEHGPVIHLDNGETIAARLTVLASGLNNGLFEALGLGREVVSKSHSVSIGFDVEPATPAGFPFASLTYYGESPRDRVGYLTLFPIGSRMRANLFVYRDGSDPWIKDLRRAPEETLFATLPRLRSVTGDFKITGGVKFRPLDLVNSMGYEDKTGLVLVGDAFATACPTSGTGAGKAFCDVERLCSAHVSRWLAQDGAIGPDLTAAFYNDPNKRASDMLSRDVSLFAKRHTLDESLPGTLSRWARYVGSRVRALANHGPWTIGTPQAKGMTR